MEIIVRRNDLVQGAPARPGDRGAEELHPDPLERPRGGARGRAAHLGHRPRRLAALRLRGPGRDRRARITLGAKKLYEIVRSLPESDVHLKVLPDAWATIECERVIFKMAGLPREDFPSLPDGKAERGSRDPGRRPAGAHRPHRLRHHRRGRPLLPGRRAARARQGRRRHGGDRRSPPRLRAAEGGAQGHREPTRVLVPRKAINELGRLLEGEESVRLPAGGEPPRLLRRGPDPRLQDGRGQFPAFEKVIAVTGDKTVAVDREALATAIRRVSLLSSERSRAVKLQPRDRPARAAPPPRRTWARPASRCAAEYAGGDVEIGFNAQYLLDFLAVAGTRDRGARAQGRGEPGGPAPGGDDGHRLPLRRHADAVLGRLLVWVRVLALRDLQEHPGAGVELDSGPERVRRPERPGQDLAPRGGGPPRPRPLLPDRRPREA